MDRPSQDRKDPPQPCARQLCLGTSSEKTALLVIAALSLTVLATETVDVRLAERSRPRRGFRPWTRRLGVGDRAAGPRGSPGSDSQMELHVTTSRSRKRGADDPEKGRLEPEQGLGQRGQLLSEEEPGPT